MWPQVKMSLTPLTWKISEVTDLLVKVVLAQGHDPKPLTSCHSGHDPPCEVRMSPEAFATSQKGSLKLPPTHGDLDFT